MSRCAVELDAAHDVFNEMSETRWKSGGSKSGLWLCTSKSGASKGACVDTVRVFRGYIGCIFDHSDSRCPYVSLMK